jgi:hypothetical protein
LLPSVSLNHIGVNIIHKYSTNAEKTEKSDPVERLQLILLLEVFFNQYFLTTRVLAVGGLPSAPIKVIEI